LTATQNDNGYVTMFFLLMPALTSLISFSLPRWIADLRFISGPGFFLGMALVTTPLLLLSLSAARAAASPTVPGRSGKGAAGLTSKQTRFSFASPSSDHWLTARTGDRSDVD